MEFSVEEKEENRRETAGLRDETRRQGVTPMGTLSISTLPLASYLNRRYHDLEATLYIMSLLAGENVVDGFEFQLLAEWNALYPPLCMDTKYNRVFEWEISRKYTVQEIAGKVNKLELNVVSVHANRDIGVCLSSKNRELIQRGKRLIEDALYLADMIRAGVCVFHLWDTWIEDIDHDTIRETFGEVTSEYPEIKASVENIPTFEKSVTPYALADRYRWVTLDTKWALKYRELAKFRRIREKIVNVHLRGTCRKGKWLCGDSVRLFDDLLRKIWDEWQLCDLITLEPDEELKDIRWKDFTGGVSVLREHTARIG